MTQNTESALVIKFKTEYISTFEYRSYGSIILHTHVCTKPCHFKLGQECRSDLRPPGIQSFTGWILWSGNILLWSFSKKINALFPETSRYCLGWPFFFFFSYRKSMKIIQNTLKLVLVFVKHYAPNICLSPNMAEFAVS